MSKIVALMGLLWVMLAPSLHIQPQVCRAPCRIAVEVRFPPPEGRELQIIISGNDYGTARSVPKPDRSTIYEFPGLPADEYDVSVRVPGVWAAKQHVTVIED